MSGSCLVCGTATSSLSRAQAPPTNLQQDVTHFCLVSLVTPTDIRPGPRRQRLPPAVGQLPGAAQPRQPTGVGTHNFPTTESATAATAPTAAATGAPSPRCHPHAAAVHQRRQPRRPPGPLPRLPDLPPGAAGARRSTPCISMSPTTTCMHTASPLARQNIHYASKRQGGAARPIQDHHTALLRTLRLERLHTPLPPRYTQVTPLCPVHMLPDPARTVDAGAGGEALQHFASQS